jgi:hypothetical protein
MGHNIALNFEDGVTRFVDPTPRIGSGSTFRSTAATALVAPANATPSLANTTAATTLRMP